jgi:hypothetical protein
MRHTFLCSFLALAAMAPAQELRRGLIGADAVVVGRQVGKTPHGEHVVLHRVQVVHDVRGANGATAVTVLDWPQLSLHQRPTPRQSRLYCLQDATQTAARLGLPATEGPFFKMVAWPGTNPLVGAEAANDPVVKLASLLAASEAGAAPVDTANALFTTALHGHASVRSEAAKLLGERPDLRANLVGLQWSQLVQRAAGETDDVGYKVALAELCAEQRLDGVFDALVVGLSAVADPEYARTVGRIGKALHGEDAATRLGERLRQAGQAELRAKLLLALGATSTDTALDALLRMDRKDAAVEAALREHRSPKAQEAAGKKR